MTDIKITGGSFSNFKTAIKVEGSARVAVDGVTFDNIGHAFDAGPSAEIESVGSRIVRNPSPADQGKSFLGYAPALGPPLPASCAECGNIFPSTHYTSRSSKFYGFDNEDICPRCGNEHAKLADGLFDLTDEVARIIEAEPITYAMLAKISSITKDVLAGTLPAADAAERIATISPRLGARMRAIANSPMAVAWFSAFLTIFGIALPYMIPPSQDETCTIAETIKTQGRYVTYEITTTVEACLAEMAKTRASSKPEPAGNDAGAPPQEETVKEAPPASIENESHTQAEKAGKDPELPMSGPVPRKRPKR